MQVGCKRVNIICGPCQGTDDKTVGRSFRETDYENRYRLGHPRSPYMEGGSMYSRASVRQKIAEHCWETKRGSEKDISPNLSGVVVLLCC